MSMQVRIIGCILGVMAILGVVYLVRRNKLLTLYSVTWFILGIGLILFSIFESLIFHLSEIMGIHFPPLAFLVLVAMGQTLILIHLSIIVSQQYSLIKKLEKDVAILESINTNHKT